MAAPIAPLSPEEEVRFNAGAEVYKREVIHPLGDPVSREGATS